MNTIDINMNSGDMRTRLRVESPNRSTESTMGERSVSFIDVGGVWAEVKPLTGKELERGKAVSASVSHAIIFRYRPDLRPDFRFRLGDRMFSIDALIDVNNGHKKHVAYCTEVVSVA